MSISSNSSTLSVDIRVECNIDLSKMVTLIKKYQKSDREGYVYTPDGISCNETQLTQIAFRLGIVAALKSQCERGAMTGILFNCYEPSKHMVITVYSCQGDQLQEDWHRVANQILNYSNEELIIQLKSLSTQDATLCKPNVMIVRESSLIPRSASIALASAVEMLRGRVKINNEITGAQLRYTLNHSRLQSVYFTDIPINETKYFNDLHSLCSLLFKQSTSSTLNYKNHVFLDFSNGVNSNKCRKLINCIKNYLRIETYHRPEVIKKRQAGAGFVFTCNKNTNQMSLVPGAKYVTMNYEGSKVMYFCQTSTDSPVTLFDGSRLSVLFSMYFKDLLFNAKSSVPLTVVLSSGCDTQAVHFLRHTLKVNVIQSHSFDRNALLKEASRHPFALVFDEEGFGTVHLEPKLADQVFQSAQTGCLNNKRLWALHQTFGLTKGDAFATFIATEAILCHFNLSLDQWKNLYTSSVQLRLQVLIKATQLNKLTEDRFPCTLLSQIQSEVNLVESRFQGSRVVFRPCARRQRIKVMIEAADEREAQQLAFYVIQILDEYLN